MMSRIVSYSVLSAELGDLNGLYRSLEVNYPKFFKMDSLSKAGFLAAEMALAKAGLRNDMPKPDMAIVLMNSSSSTCDDVEFQKGLAPDAYFPSPSLFVYTLSNIVCGEIAIRNRIMGESSFYVRKEFDAGSLVRAAGWALQDSSAKYVLCGWLETFEPGARCIMMLVSRDGDEGMEFNEENINQII